jgi:phospholipid/cholesterol/gamma-HCH transport system substrate-binding protein
MPRTRSIAWSELKLGVVGIVAVLLTTVSIVAVGGASGFWWERYGLKTRFDDVQGLKTGAVVRVSGKEVGTVKAVDFAGNQVEVALEISKDVQRLITTESVATIGSLSLLGEPIVDVKAAPEGTPLKEWEFIKSARVGKSMGELSSTVSDGLDEVKGLLTDIRSGRGTLGKLATDDALYRDLQAFVASASKVTDQLKGGDGTIAKLMQDPTAYNALKASLENLQLTTTRLNTGRSGMARLLNDDALGASIAAATTNLERISGRLASGQGTAGKLLADQQVYDQLNSVTKRIDDLLAGLKGTGSTAGLLLNDKQLHENMNGTLTELRALLADIRKDPKKYLRVNVSIF